APVPVLARLETALTQWESADPPPAAPTRAKPCATATGTTIAEAYVRARDADPLSAYGGIVGLNPEVDADTAKALTSTFIEAGIAPSLASGPRPLPPGKQNIPARAAAFAAPANPPPT